MLPWQNKCPEVCVRRAIFQANWQPLAASRQPLTASRRTSADPTFVPLTRQPTRSSFEELFSPSFYHWAINSMTIVGFEFLLRVVFFFRFPKRFIKAGGVWCSVWYMLHMLYTDTSITCLSVYYSVVWRIYLGIQWNVVESLELWDFLDLQKL